MENVQGYSDGEGSEAASRSYSDTDRSNDSSDESDGETGGATDTPAEDVTRSGAGFMGSVKSGLMSATDLFAVQVDTVYVRPPSKEFEVPPTEGESDKNVVKKYQPAVIEKKAVQAGYPPAADPVYAAVTEKPKGPKNEPQAQNKKSKTNSAKKRDVEDLNAKDKIKRQRLSGQSGIGSDFKEWRSEEEMRQRQMFD